MASGEMRKLFWKFRWAGKGFMFKGLWFCWAKLPKTNYRIIPLNRFDNWLGGLDE